MTKVCHFGWNVISIFIPKDYILRDRELGEAVTGQIGG